MKRLNKKGFTLIELVIVILVIAILAVVLIPQLSSMSNKAKNTGVQSAFREFQTAAQSVLLTNNRYDCNVATESSKYGIKAVEALNRYLDTSNQIMLISNDNLKSKEAGNAGTLLSQTKVTDSGTLTPTTVYGQTAAKIFDVAAGSVRTAGTDNGAYCTVNRLDPYGTPYLVSFGYSVYNTTDTGSGSKAKVPSYSLVEFRSAGPDQNFNTKDDMVTWVQWEDGSAGTYQYNLEGGDTWNPTFSADNSANHMDPVAPVTT